MRITSVAPGSKFVVAGNEYTLCQIPDDGGYQWLGKDGSYALAQAFYFHDNPSIENLVSMQKHLPPFEALGREEGLKQLAVGLAPHTTKSVQEIIAQLSRTVLVSHKNSITIHEGVETIEVSGKPFGDYSAIEARVLAGLVAGITGNTCKKAVIAFKQVGDSMKALKVSSSRKGGKGKQYFNEKG